MSLDRYRRHELIDWFDQQAIAATRVAVIGAGAIGNEVIKNLALLGTGQIDIFDFDRIEAHNLTRSALFRESDVGRPKAVVAAERTRELDPNISVNSFDQDFWDAMALHTLADDYDVVMGCVDNFEARMRASLMCRLAGVNFVSAAIDSRFASVQVHPFADGSDSACFECDLGAGVYELVAKRYSCGWLQRTAFVEKKVPTTAITAAAAGALAASRALRLGNPDERHGGAERIMMDTITGRSSVLGLGKNIDCLGCGDIPETVDLDCRSMTALIEAHPGAAVRLSEAVITAYACQADSGHTDATEQALLNSPAAHQRDSLMLCPVCNDTSVRIELAEECDLPLAGSAGSPLGCKFVRLRQPDNSELVIELDHSV